MSSDRQPEFFFDRSLGKISARRLREAGYVVHLIAEYEIPKYEGDLGRPNVFAPLSPETAEHKLALLQEHFPSQHGKYWFRRELFSGIMAIRGVEAGVTWAEGFHVRKFVM